MILFETVDIKWESKYKPITGYQFDVNTKLYLKQWISSGKVSIN